MPLLFWYGHFLMLFKRRARALEVFRTVTRQNPRHRHGLELSLARLGRQAK